MRVTERAAHRYVAILKDKGVPVELRWSEPPLWKTDLKASSATVPVFSHDAVGNRAR